MCEQLEGLTAKQESERGQLSEKDAQLTEQALKSKHRQRVLEGQVLYPCNPLSNANAGGRTEKCGNTRAGAEAAGDRAGAETQNGAARGQESSTPSHHLAPKENPLPAEIVAGLNPFRSTELDAGGALASLTSRRSSGVPPAVLAALFRGQGCRENRVGLPSSTKEVAPTPHRPPLAPIATAHYEGRPGVMMMLRGTRTLVANRISGGAKGRRQHNFVERERGFALEYLEAASLSRTRKKQSQVQRGELVGTLRTKCAPAQEWSWHTLAE